MLKVIRHYHPSSVEVEVNGNSAWANFANFAYGSTSGMVYLDVNGDADATGEIGYEDVTVYLALMLPLLILL